MSDHARWKMKQAAAKMHSWEGTTERPAGSNRISLAGIGDLWDYVYPPYQGGAYCAAGDVAAYLVGGIDLRKLLTNPYYCPNWVAFARRNGFWKTSSPVVGDLVMYGNGEVSIHTGLASPAPGTLFYAHEANTSSGASGSQNDGGGVYHRGRGRSWIMGWVHMEKVIDYMIRTGLYTPGPDQAADAPPKSTKARKLLAVDGEMGPKTYLLLSRFSKQTAEQANGKWTRTDVLYLQRRLGVRETGRWDEATSRALQRKIGAKVDGDFGRKSVAALQRHLNRGVLAGWWSLP